MNQPSYETAKLILTLIRPVSEKIWREQCEKKQNLNKEQADKSTNPGI